MAGGRGLADRVQRAREWISRTVLTGAGLWVLLGLEAVLLTAWALVGAEGWRPGSLAPLALDGLLLLGGAGVLLGARRWLRRELEERRLSRHMEVAAGLDPGTVGGSLELGRSLPPGVSPSLARLAESARSRAVMLCLANRLGIPRSFSPTSASHRTSHGIMVSLPYSSPWCSMLLFVARSRWPILCWGILKNRATFST